MKRVFKSYFDRSVFYVFFVICITTTICSFFPFDLLSILTIGTSFIILISVYYLSTRIEYMKYYYPIVQEYIDGPFNYPLKCKITKHGIGSLSCKCCKHNIGRSQDKTYWIQCSKIYKAIK